MMDLSNRERVVYLFSHLVKRTMIKDFAKRKLDRNQLDKAREVGMFVLTEVPQSKQVIGEFVHLSIQEFLAMTEVLTQTAKEARDMLTIMFQSGQFNMALLFLYGFAFNTSSDVIKKLSLAIGRSLKVQEEVCSLLKEMIHTVPDDLQVLQMVHESQVPELAREVGKRRFKKEIKFSNIKLTIVDILAVEFLLKHYVSATSVSLKNVGLDAINLKEIGRFLEVNKTVDTIQLFDNGVDDEGIQFLAEALKSNENLNTVVIESNSLTDESMISLGTALKVNNALGNLRIESNQVTSKGVEAFAASLESNKKLTNLKFLGNGLTDDGVKALAASLASNKTVERLELFSRNITNEGVKCLASALQLNSTVKHLDLEWTQLDDFSAQDLLHALAVSKTVHVRIGAQLCSQEKTRELRRHPKISITSI